MLVPPRDDAAPDPWALTPPPELLDELPELPPLGEDEVPRLPPIPPEELPASSLLGLRPIESVEITGRGWRKPYTAYSFAGGGICLQFSDSVNHEIWAQVIIHQELLGEMLAAVLAHHEDIADETLALIRGLVEQHTG